MTAQNASASGSADLESISASGCSWKTTTSMYGDCFLEPRTCSECLNETPTTGETCVLTNYGMCLSQEDYESILDSGDDAYYVAGNATYCSSSNSSSDDCVQLDICESSSWLSYARQRLALVIVAVRESTPDGCNVATDSVNAATDTNTTSDDAASASSASKDTLSSEDKCTWYQNTTVCSTPRTCYDCLNVEADSGEACTITPDGYCASLSKHYDYSLDFRVANSSGATNGYYFPSTNTTYCEPSDVACTDCGFSSSTSNSASYCMGSDGCVCVAFCQSSQWEEIVVSEKCEASSVASTPTLYETIFPWKTVCISVAVGIVVVLAVALGVWRVRRVILARRRDSLRSQRSQTRISGLSLELPAWKAMQEELIENNADPVGVRGRLSPV